MSDDHKKARTSEATIVIDGVKLSSSQSMTVRVALDSFRDQLFERGLGDDAHGISMVESYTKNAAEVINIILGEPNRGRAG